MTRAKIPDAISTVLPICERDRNRVVYEYSQPCSEGRTESRSQLLLVCQSAREEAHSMGFDQGRNEKLRVTQTGAGRPNRVHRMDAGWSPEAFEVCRVEGV